MEVTIDNKKITRVVKQLGRDGVFLTIYFQGWHLTWCNIPNEIADLIVKHYS